MLCFRRYPKMECCMWMYRLLIQKEVCMIMRPSKSFFSNPTVIPAETEPESKENVKISKSDRDLLLSQQKIPDKNAKKAEPKLATDEYADTPLITKLDEKRQAKETKSLVLNWPRDVKLLQSELPSRCVDRNWELLYSTAEHGISISTFFRKVRFPFSRFKSTWLGRDQFISFPRLVPALLADRGPERYRACFERQWRPYLWSLYPLPMAK